MSLSSVLKKVLPLLLVLVIIIVFAVTCTAIKGKEKEMPVPTGYDTENYVEVKEGNFTYVVKKNTMYDLLKGNFGLSTIITKFDKAILQAEKLGEKSYFDSITEEEIIEAYEEAVFPDGKEELTQEEIDEATTDYFDTMFTSFGYKTIEEIYEYHQLVLAKKLYAKTKLAEEIKEQDEKAAKDAADSTIKDEDKEKPYFDEDEVKEYYTANYVDGYWAIILPFNSQTSLENALAQLGIHFHAKDSSTINYNCWAKEENGETKALTVSEVVKAFIELYNMVYGYKAENYPTNKAVLVEGVHYKVSADGVYSFIMNHDEENEDAAANELYWSHTELGEFQSSVQTYIKNSMYSYNPETSVMNDTTSSNSKWYTSTSRTYSSVSYIILKLGEVKAPKQEEVENEIKEKLAEEALTDEYINTKMAELRAEKNITIFDAELEESYIASVDKFDVEHKATKKESSTVVAKIDGLEITADQLFKEMDTVYGPASVLSEITYERFLTNTELNEYYKKETDEWVSKDKYKEVLESISNLKLAFSSGSYSYYGYDPSTMTWEDFLQDVNGVKDENELKYYYLYGAVLDDEIAKFNNIVETEEDDDEKYVLTEDSDLWKFYVEYMEKIQKDYFSVKGVHALISVYENALDAINLSKNQVDPEDWSEEQIKLAKELHDQILVYINEQSGTIQEKLQAIATAFKDAPYYVTYLGYTPAEQPKLEDAEYTFENIEVSKFKSAGLTVQYQDLGEFANGEMVEAFDKAVKSIWDKDPESTELTIYEDYLQTEFGFHIYANLESKPIAEWTDKAIFRLHEDENGKADYVEWKYVGESEWVKLIDLSTAGIKLEDNLTVTFQIAEEQVQYKYVDTKDSDYKDEWKNLISVEEAGIDTEKKAVLPSLGLVRTYLANSSDPNMTTEMTTAYTTYFQKLYEEVNGSGYFQMREYASYKDLDIQFKSGNYTKADFDYTVDKSIESTKESFTIIFVEDKE